jgi:hypothetical protein
MKSIVITLLLSTPFAFAESISLEDIMAAQNVVTISPVTYNGNAVDSQSAGGVCLSAGFVTILNVSVRSLELKNTDIAYFTSGIRGGVLVSTQKLEAGTIKVLDSVTCGRSIATTSVNAAK